MLKEPKKRRGGRIDSSEMYLNYSRRELMVMLRRIERRCIRYRLLSGGGEKIMINLD